MKYCIVAHAPLASAFQSVVKDIGGSELFVAIDLQGHQSPEAVSTIVAQMHEVAPDEEWVFFVDILGGSPMNSLMPIMLKDKVRVIAGINLSLLLSALQWKSIDDLDFYLLNNANANFGIREVAQQIKSSHRSLIAEMGLTGASD